MPSLPPIPQVPREVLVAIGAVVVLLALWLWVRYGRRHYLVIQNSNATESIAYELGRIATALERLAPPREVQAPAGDQPPRRVNWLSMFGR
jgi:hypothetical protein